MFTGIISATGQVAEITRENGARIGVSVPFEPDSVEIGASVACSGVCLTVANREADKLVFEASEETLRRTTLGAWKKGTRINIERSLKAGDEMGGHVVMGHIDATAEILGASVLEGAKKLEIALPAGIAPLVAEKGSIAVDGVSLTVNRVRKDRFEVAIIPHTAKVTTLGELKRGDKVNLEADVFARYSARLHEFGK